MDKPLDVAQLSTCCGKPLVWDCRRCEEPGCTCGGVWWDATCPMCGCLNADGMPSAERDLLPTEKLLLARNAELEAALRWRVTAEEMPPVGVEVLGCYGDGCQIVSRSVAKPSRWLAQDAGTTDQPDRWQPLPGVPDAK